MGASEHRLPVLTIAGPVTGLFVQPLTAAFSDKTRSDWFGRRKPAIFFGAFPAGRMLIVFPFAGVRRAGVVCLWLPDIGNDTTAGPARQPGHLRLPEVHHRHGLERPAILLSGVLLACGAISMLRVDPPRADEESPLIPARRTARLPIGVRRGDRRLGRRQKSTTSERIRQVEPRVVASPPARALLQTAGDNPENLIVVGNRGLAALTSDGDPAHRGRPRVSLVDRRRAGQG